MASHQKKADEEKYTILWVDEAGFYLLPMAVRTWAPRGQTPILRVKLTRDHLSAISGITLDGRLFMQVRKTSYDAEATIGFLQMLLRKISGKILIIWDGSPIHRNHKIKAFLKAGAAKRLHLEQLPGMLLISTLMRASGSISSELNWAMFVVLTWTTCIRRLSALKNVYDTNAILFAVAHNNVATWFS